MPHQLDGSARSDQRTPRTAHSGTGRPTDTQAGPVVHVVVRGETLAGVARTTLGTADRWPQIYELNKAVIGPDPTRITPGQRLTLPSATP